MSTETTLPIYDLLTEIYDQQSAVPEYRQKAFNSFRSQGFPTIKNEEWKYTNVQPFLKEQYTAAVTEATVTTEDIKPFLIKGLDAHLIVLVNGKLNKSLSTFQSDVLISIEPLTEVPGYAADSISFTNNAFAALNTALTTSGLFIEVKANATINKPLHIIHYYTSDDNVFVQPRHMVCVHKNAKLDIIESVARDESKGIVWVNSVTQAYVEENAQFSQYVLQNGAANTRLVNFTEAVQHKYSLYNNFTFTFPGTELVRNTLHTRLAESATETHLYGLYIGADNQLIDNHTLVDHRKPNCLSNELYKGVLAGHAKAVFNGKVYVHQEAQKTNAFQQNNNLQLSDKASINSKPQLEIFADDVKCSHGSTVGQFNPDALFYLRSRGIEEATARALLIGAFAFDVVEKVTIPALREHIETLLNNNMENWYA
ncbi:MAG: Fe-S cluster assembly protein SufD [Filimonas sp.]|nr:Fe-S cluster assembly protein SufD [Filimonas sp.]